MASPAVVLCVLSLKHTISTQPFAGVFSGGTWARRGSQLAEGFWNGLAQADLRHQHEQPLEHPCHGTACPAGQGRQSQETAPAEALEQP